TPPSRLAPPAALPGPRSRRRRSPDGTPRARADSVVGPAPRSSEGNDCSTDRSEPDASLEKPVLLSFADHGGRETDDAGDRRAPDAPGVRARRARRPADDDRGPGLRR